MKKSLGLLMIVIAVIAMAFVSCDASTAPKADAVGEVVLDSSQSRGISVTVDNTVDVETLYWYYKAEKKDNGLFNTGVTDGFVPVKKPEAGVAKKGLQNANLGLFSYGNWEFTLRGVVAPITGNTIADADIMYSGSQTIDVNKDKNFLNLTLIEGNGLTTEIKFDTNEGIWFSHSNIVTGKTFSLTAVDYVNGVERGTITSGSATVEAGKVSFKNMSYTAPAGGVAEGQHVMRFTLTQNDVDANIATVATYELTYTVTKGYTHTIKGDLTSAEVKGEVEVDTYAKSVPATTATLVLPVTVSETGSSKTVKAETTVSTLDLSVTYHANTVLTTETNTAGSGDNVTADATIGFMLNPNVEGGISVSVIQPNQDLTKYQLTLNVDSNNTTLVEVSKFIGKNLEIEGVYHKGNELRCTNEERLTYEHYYYTPSTGILKLYVMNASPIDIVTKKVPAVAEIGDEKFTTLSAAIEAAADVHTITILSGANVTLENGIANEGDKSRDITFIGNRTQTVDVITNAVSAERGMLNYQRGSSFTFENLTIKAGEGDFDGIVCDELTFKDCTIKGKLTLYGKATFINCVFDNTMANQYSIWTWGGTDVKFEGCTFNTNGKAILLYGGASATNPTNLVVNNCTFNDRNNGAAGKAAIEIGNDYNATYTLTVINATVNGFAPGLNTNSTLWANKNSMDAAHLTVTIAAVAEIGEEKFTNLQAAIDASNDAEIKILENISLIDSPITIPKGKVITIDTAGHTIKSIWKQASASAAFKVNNGAKLTLKGNGSIEAYAEQPDVTWTAGFPGYANNAITNSGELIIDGATVKVTTDKVGANGELGASYCIDSYAGSTLEIKSGEIINNQNIAIRLFTSSAGDDNKVNVTIDEGKIEGSRGIWIQLAGSNSEVAPKINLTINGGAIKTNESFKDADNDCLALYSYSFGNSFANTKVTIENGNFLGYVAFGGGYKGDQETVEIKGGTFTAYNSDGTMDQDCVGRYTNSGWKSIAH